MLSQNKGTINSPYDDEDAVGEDTFHPAIKEERSQSLVDFGLSTGNYCEEASSYFIQGFPYGSNTFIQQHFGIHSWERALETPNSLQSIHGEGYDARLGEQSQTQLNCGSTKINQGFSCNCLNKYKYLDHPEDCDNNNNHSQDNNNNIDDSCRHSPHECTENEMTVNCTHEAKRRGSKTTENGKKYPHLGGLRVDIGSDCKKPNAAWREDMDEALHWLRQQIVQMKQQDRALMRQLLELRSTIHQLRGPSSLFRSGPDLTKWASTDGGSLFITSATPFHRREDWRSFQNRTVSMLTMAPSLGNDDR